MLDISTLDLPETLTVLDKEKGQIKGYRIQTDFRCWLQVSSILDKAIEKEAKHRFTFTNEIKDTLSILFLEKSLYNASTGEWETIGKKPDTDKEWQEIKQVLFNFYNSPVATPNPKKADKKAEKVFDFNADGEYIFSSFYQAYKINLLEVNMHWHIFMALFRGLPSNTKICEIISKRCWEKPEKNIKEEEIREKEKELWKLPEDKEKEAEEEKEINDLFPYTS